MLGSFSALMIRSLRTEARLPLSHAVRLLFIGLILGMLKLARQNGPLLSAPGLRIFEMICWLNLMLITVAGATWFASVITEEKEDGTLGLLRMAGVSPLVLVLGKSTARLISASLVLSVQFPFTLLAITLGGVTFDQVHAAYAALFAYLVLVANLGLLCSVWSRNSASAAKKMVILLVVFFLAVPILSRISLFLSVLPVQFREVSQLETVVDWLRRALQPIVISDRLSSILRTGFMDSAWGSWQVHVSLGLALASFITAWQTFEYFTHESLDVGRSRWAEFWQIRGARRRVWRGAIAWKEFYFLAGGFRWLVIKCLIYGALLLAAVVSECVARAAFPFESFVFCAWIGMTLEAAALTMRLFGDDAHEKTFPLLLMLPISIPQCCWLKVAGTLPGIAPAVVFFCLGLGPQWDSVFRDVLVLAGLISSYVLFLHLIAYFSLFSKWGSIPLAVLGISVSWMSLVFLMQYLQYLRDPNAITAGFEQILFGTLLVKGLVGIAILQFLMVRRIRALAAQ